jgi:hypothetical protein
MKLKYDLNTGEVLCMGAMPNLSGDGVVDVSFDIPSDSLGYYTFNGTALVRKDQGVIDKMNAEQGFSVDTMLGAMGLEFTGMEALQLTKLGIGWAIQNYASSPFRNFKGIKDMIAGAVALTDITQDQADRLYAIFAQQGIILGDYV